MLGVAGVELKTIQMKYGQICLSGKIFADFRKPRDFNGKITCYLFPVWLSLFDKIQIVVDTAGAC